MRHCSATTTAWNCAPRPLARLRGRTTTRPAVMAHVCDLQPRRLLLDNLRPGDKRQMELTVTNQGGGLLHGTLAVTAGVRWLRVLGADGDGTLRLEVSTAQRVLLEVETEGLPAAADSPGPADGDDQRRRGGGPGLPRFAGPAFSSRPFPGGRPSASPGGPDAPTPKPRCHCFTPARWRPGSRPTAGTIP